MRNLKCTQKAEERMKRKRKKFKARNQNGGIKERQCFSRNHFLAVTQQSKKSSVFRC